MRRRVAVVVFLRRVAVVVFLRRVAVVVVAAVYHSLKTPSFRLVRN